MRQEKTPKIIRILNGACSSTELQYTIYNLLTFPDDTYSESASWPGKLYYIKTSLSCQNPENETKPLNEKRTNTRTPSSMCVCVCGGKTCAVLCVCIIHQKGQQKKVSFKTKRKFFATFFAHTLLGNTSVLCFFFRFFFKYTYIFLNTLPGVLGLPFYKLWALHTYIHLLLSICRSRTLTDLLDFIL